MKKILFLSIFIFFMFSCDSQVVNETKQIWNDYIKTLDNAPDDAQNAVDLINKRQKNINKIKE